MSRGRPGNDYDDEDVLYEQNSERTDQRTLLGNKVKTSPSNTDAKIPRRFLKTCLLCAGFLGLGLCTAILGTSLLDLRSKANGTLQQMFYVVTARNVGVLIGSLVSGHCFDRFDHNFLMASSLLGLAAFGAMVPWCNTMILLFTAVALWGIAIGFLNAGGNIFCVNLWGKKTGPFVQALHFSLGVGALIAPFIAEPFVAYNQLQSNGTNVTDNHLHRPHLPCWVNTTVLAMSEKTHSKRSVFEDVGWMIDTYHLDEDDVKNLNMLNSDVDSGYHARHLLEAETGGSGEETTVVTGTMGSTSTEIVTEKPGMTIQSTETQTTQRAKTSAKDDKATTPGKPEITEELSTTQSNDNSSESESSETMTSKIKGLLNTVTKYIPHASQIQKAYMIIAMYNVAVSIPFFWFFCSGPRFLIFAKRAAISTGTDGSSEDGKKVFRFLLLIALFLFFFLYKGIEESFGAYIYTFAKCIQLEFSSLNAVHLNAVFWGTFALGRLLAICIATFLHPKVMLIPSMVGMVVSLILLAVLGNTNSGALWSGTVLLGLSMSSVFPAAIAWAERYILLTGKAVASFFISSSVAGILIPWLLGMLFRLEGITVLMKLLMALAVALFLLYIIMQILASRKGERPSSSLPDDSTKQLLSALEEEVVELENMAANNNPLRKNRRGVEETTHGVTDRQNISKTTINGTAEDVMTAQSNQSSNASDFSDTMTSKIKGLLNTVTYYIHHTSQIQTAYMIIAMYNVVIAIPFFWFFYSGPGFFIFAKRAAISTGTEGAADEGRKVFRLILLIALFLFFFLYKGIEESFGAYIYTFAKCIQLEFSSLNAVHLNAVFWGTFALGRLLAICIAAFLHPKVMLIPSMVGMVVSLILLAVLGNTNSGALWSGTVLLGLSMSSVFPAAIAWAERYILLTGKAVASFFISSSVAGILIPWLLGILFQLQGITVLMKLLVALCAALFLLYIIMQILASRQGERPSSKGQNDNAKQLLSALEEEVVELESIAANNNPSKGKQNEGDKHKLSQAIRRLHKDLKHD